MGPLAPGLLGSWAVPHTHAPASVEPSARFVHGAPPRPETHPTQSRAVCAASLPAAPACPLRSPAVCQAFGISGQFGGDLRVLVLLTDIIKGGPHFWPSCPSRVSVTISFCGWCARLRGERSPGRGPGRALLSRGSSSEPGVSCRARRPLFWSLWGRRLQSAPGCVNAGHGTWRSRPLGPCTWPWTPGPGVSLCTRLLARPQPPRLVGRLTEDWTCVLASPQSAQGWADLVVFSDSEPPLKNWFL